MPMSTHNLNVPSKFNAGEFSSIGNSFESKSGALQQFSANVRKDETSITSKDDTFEKNHFFSSSEIDRGNKLDQDQRKTLKKNMDTLKEAPEENEMIEDDDSNYSSNSEDFSASIMDEKTSNIQKKIQETTLTKR